MKFSQLFTLMTTLSQVFNVFGHFTTQLNGWYPCSDVTFSDETSQDLTAECAVYTAPLCYPGICDASKAREVTVDIFVKRISALNSETARNVWVLQGGPGDSSTAMESLMIDLYQRLKGAVNVYTMDHRGTGRSTALDCVAAQALTTGSPYGSNLDPLEVPDCAEDLHFKYGDLASFSTTSAATDIATFIATYTNKAHTIVYGVSYGTALLERLIHLNPPTVTGYVLDGIATSSGASVDQFEYFSTWNIDFGEVGDRFLALCKRNDECVARFKRKGLQKTLQSLLTKFDKAPNSTCASLLLDVTSDLTNESPSLILRSVLSSLLGHSTLRKLIPPVVHRLNRCSLEDMKVLTHFVAILNEDTAYTSQEDAFFSPLLYYLITFSEMWENPSPSIEIMRKRFTNAKISDPEVFMNTPLYCAFSKENSTVCNALNVNKYPNDGIIYPHDQYWNKSARIPTQASVLLLNGKLDPMTPYKYAEYLLDALDGDNKELITFEYAVHDIISSTPLDEDGEKSDTCGLNLLVSYVENNGDLKLLDKSCVEKQGEFKLTAPTEIVYEYLSTKDAYNGIYNSSLSSSL